MSGRCCKEEKACWGSERQEAQPGEQVVRGAGWVPAGAGVWSPAEQPEGGIAVPSGCSPVNAPLPVHSVTAGDKSSDKVNVPARSQRSCGEAM